MKRVETSDATTSRGAEGVGPAGLATPPEPGVTWSVVLGVSEGGGKEGRAISLGWEGGGRREGEEGKEDGMGVGRQGRARRQRQHGGGGGEVREKLRRGAQKGTV